MLRSVAIAACGILVLSMSSLSAQSAPNAAGSPLHATRAELEEILASYEKSAGSRAYSAHLRERAKYEASLIRQRLENGDFQVGDRIALMVEDEPTLSDTLSVTSDIAVLLPTGETLSVRKVLRSEVHERLERAIAKVVKQPKVRSETFLRLTILGAVGRQGFFEWRSDALLTDVLNQVSLSSSAVITDMRVERNKKTIWEGEALTKAITEGRTLDQLSLQAGDVINVPAQGGPGGGVLAVLRDVRSVLMLIPVYFAVRRISGW